MDITDIHEDKPRRLGFLVGQIVVPEDFDRMHQAEIESLFCVNEPPADEKSGAIDRR
ncbi:MAG: hypothetical protein JJU27_11805 [Gammaproteobacteria bacterium]|nr:hypothetical protein [Gammaproteobacteria bacterium]